MSLPKGEEEFQMKRAAVLLGLFGALVSLAGCVVETVYVPPRQEIREVVVEPAPAERVYIVEAGYPPGVYEYNNLIWYEGRSYHRDVFVKNVVNVNIQNNQYTNVTENRIAMTNVKAMHERQYAAGVKRSVAPTNTAAHAQPHTEVASVNHLSQHPELQKTNTVKPAAVQKAPTPAPKTKKTPKDEKK